MLKSKKPDRLTRLVRKAFPGNGPDDEELVAIVTLLRREQRAQRARVRRIVKTMKRDYTPFPSQAHCQGFHEACTKLLAALHGRTP